MAIFKMDGKTYDFPDDWTDKDFNDYISSKGSSGQSTVQGTSSPTYAERPKGVKVDPDTLQYDKDWTTASRTLFEKTQGKAFQGSQKDLAEWGLDQMGWFNYNLPSMALDANRLRNAGKAEKDSFLHLMDTYDQLEMSWGGFGRFIKGAAADPTNYFGLATFGLGAAAAQGTKIASKEGVKALLRTATVAGIEGGLFMGADNAIRQSVEISGGRKDSVNLGEVATSAAIGVGAGAILGGGFEAGRMALRGGLPAKGVDGAIVKAADDPLATGATKVADDVNGPVVDANSVTNSVTNNVANTPSVASTPNIANAPSIAARGMDEAVSGLPPITVQDVIAAVKSVAPDFVDGVQRTLTREEVSTAARQASDMLQSLGIKDAEDAKAVLSTLNVSPDEGSILKLASQEAAQVIGLLRNDLIKAERAASTPAEKSVIRSQLVELSVTQNALSKLDVGLSSTSGGDLGARRGGIFVGDLRGVTPESILAERNIDPAKATPDAIRAAEDEYSKRIESFMTKIETNKEVSALEQKIIASRAAGDIDTAVAASAERSALMTKLAEDEARSTGVLSSAYKKFNDTVLTRTNEYVISTVFTPATIVVNVLPALVKSLYKPFLEYIVKGPFDQAAFRQMTATYSAMASVQGAAFNAARTAFKYERSGLTGDTSKLLESGNVISGLKGRVLRTFPRLLTASDEYFSQVIYRGFVVGEATSDAVIAGTKQGLKGENLDAFIKDQVEKAVSNAYSTKADTVNVIDFLRQQGIDRGYSGTNLSTWVKSELEKNPEFFKSAVNQSGKNYADDILFKRKFSGDSKVSELAIGYEKFINQNPIMRLVGQLFFRTPVRVFEEGIRLTPGLNLISPGFVADLKGANGSMKQVRAQGEALMAYGIGASVLALYANGSITSGGPDDFKQRRSLENGKKFEPYTITFRDGSTFSFRNLDPFATPFKIITNALDRYQTLQYRKAQGEYVEKAEKEALAWLGVGVGSVAQAIRDASLTEGIDQLLTFAEAIGDPESNESKLTKLLGQKAQLAVPNVINKTLIQDNPVLNDPKTLEQFIRARVNPSDQLVPRQYNELGNVRTITNPLAALTGINVTSLEKRQNAVPPKEAKVLQELAIISISNNTNFMAPYKRAELGDIDMRTELTADGRSTLYDRWMKYTSDMKLVDQLYPLLVQNKLPIGTPSTKGLREEITRDTINKAREAAFFRLMSEEIKVEQRFIRKLTGSVQGKTGGKDVLTSPFQQ